MRPRPVRMLARFFVFVLAGAVLSVSVLISVSPSRGQASEALDAITGGDYTTAYRLLRPIAEEGDPQAQDKLGVMYETGRGVPQNYEEAVKWFRRAADQHYALAERNLGRMYEDGHGVTRNYDEAVKWYRRAAAQGLIPAYHNLGSMYERGRGVPQSYEEAVRWYGRAAEENFPPAEFSLGFMYDQGHGVSRDFSEAAKWYRFAAENGDPSAQNNLGLMYLSGHGVPQDYVMAYRWFDLAAALSAPGPDHETFARNRDHLASMMTREQIAMAQQRASEWHAPAVWVGPKRAAPSEIGNQPNGAAPRPHKESPTVVSGTGFFVTTDGRLLTNAHVVQTCTRVQVRTVGGEAHGAQVIATAKPDDLAVLRADMLAPGAAVFRIGTPIKQGETVTVYGFPLPGLLASSGNVTTGIVTALAGIRDDPRILQLSAPTQPGNSGAPVLDTGGNVVGIVVAKLDALRAAGATHDIPQNINFAVKASVAMNFLDARSIAYASAQSHRNLSIAEIAERAEAYTVRVECLR